MINTAISIVNKKAFTKSPVGTIISKTLSLETSGRIALRLSIFAKRLSLSMGSCSDRAIEYPWVLTQIKNIKPSSLLIDVGCAESLLSHELTSKGFKVVGLDIRNCPFKNKKMLFVKRNIMNSGLPDGTFDAAILISTVEHIGLSAYGQLTLEDYGDINAMKELHRILKPDGILIMSTPYIGNSLFRVDSFQRNYNRERLAKLVQHFQVIKEEYFYFERRRRSIYWIKMGREEIDKQNFTDPGIACLVLKKNAQ